MRQIITNTNMYRIDRIDGGAQYEVTDKQTGKTVQLDGEQAKLFHDEYVERDRDYNTPGTRAHRFTWNENLEEVCGPLFD